MRMKLSCVDVDEFVFAADHAVPEAVVDTLLLQKLLHVVVNVPAGASDGSGACLFAEGGSLLHR